MAKAPPPDESPFERFLRLGTAIFAVPKDEVAKQTAARKRKKPSESEKNQGPK
jgi:hypothetical protein